MVSLVVWTKKAPAKDPPDEFPFRRLGHNVVEEKQRRQHYEGISKTLTVKIANS